MAKRIPPQSPPPCCWACHQHLDHPRWMNVGDGQHQPVCPGCLLKIDEQFTPDNGIAAALYELAFVGCNDVRPHYRRCERTLRRVGGR